MNWRPVVGLLGVAALLFTACQLGNNASTVTGGKALIAEPTTGVTFSQDFNPYDSNSVSSSMGTRSIVNEPLIEFDELDPTAAGTHPWLATAFQFANGGKDIQLTIRQNVKFNDGSSFGPADVAATYKVVANPKANVFGAPDQASDPTISGNTVTLHFTTPQCTSLFTILGKTYVLKESVADQIAANPKLTIANPVGTGPFMLKSYSSSLIKWKPNPYYWGGPPPESEIDTPAIATNAAASDALISGQLDWAGNDIPNVYANYVPTSGSVPDGATAAASKLPAGADVYDILTGAGWKAPASSHYDATAKTFKSGGNCDGTNTANCWTKGGQIIKFSIYDPVPFSDYWENAALISQELQPLGMDVTTKPAQGYSDWNTTLTSNPAGWQTMIHWGNGGSIPYIQYYDWFQGTAAKQVGYSNADAAAALTAYASTDPNDTATLYPIVQKLEKLMSTDGPYAPLLYGADWNVFSSAKYTGWPNQSHPYMNPSPSDPQMVYIVMQLKPVS